ncbi:MAG: V-type ATP synthase subunit C [Firmicutes bacterium ADurb.Bin193]|nr:MAG: V-type ATP synthase subunit C [Firmicutes bacterium ADurb.Bin193]
MLSEIFKYSGSHAKVRAMSGKLLTAADYKSLLAKNSVSDVAAYLKNNTHYGEELKDVAENSIHRGELEEILSKSQEKQLVKLIKYEKGSSKKFLRVFILKYETELLKDMFRMLERGVLITHSDKVNEYYARHMTIDVQRLVRSQSKAQFIENLKGSDFYPIISPLVDNNERFNIFSIEMTLDLYYYNTVWKMYEKHLCKKDREVVLESFGTELDILNIMWIMRCKKYFNVPREIIYSFLLPGRHKITREQLVSLVEAKTLDELYALIQKTPYNAIFEDDGLFPEQHYYKYISELQRKLSRLSPFSIMSVISYIQKKETEVANLIKIIEGIRYKLDMNGIERYLIRNGGETVGG